MRPTQLLLLGGQLDIFTSKLGLRDDHLIRHGLIPPIPITAGENPMMIWGWEIVRRADALGIEDLTTRVAEVDLVAALKLAVRMENRTGNYSRAEQASMAALLERGRDGSGSSEADWMELSELTRGDGALRGLADQYLRLSVTAREMVNDALISVKTATRSQVVPDGFLLESRHLLEKMTFSDRRQFLEIFSELIRHSPSSDPGGAQCAGTEEIAKHAPATERLCAWAMAAMKQPKPVEAIRRLRYPTLTALEAQFEEISRRTLAGTGVLLTAPPYFEGDSFEIRFRFRSAAELQVRANALDRVKASCEDLFGLL